jgi:uncharacterized protein
VATRQLQYEDIASELDWRTSPPQNNPKFMAISADSHVTEPPEAFTRFIDPQYRDTAPRIIPNPDPKSKNNELYLCEGMPTFPFRTTSSAGYQPKDIDLSVGGFRDMHRAGWDPKHRVEAQVRDGLLAEVIYPSVGMLLCQHPDGDYKNACFRAYNLWLQEYVGEAPTRLFGIGQTAVRSPRETIDDMVRIKEQGSVGVMLPSYPSDEAIDYDDPAFDDVWRTAIELELPLNFHILTGRGQNAIMDPPRGGAIAGFGHIIRGLQDLASLFIFGRIFERHPDLRVVLVEADAGWIPHFCSRMDHAYKRHRFWMKAGEMAKLPSEYFHENIYATFQDDWVALHNIDLVNPRRLLWANDYPHADSTWPWSHKLLEHHMANLTDEQFALVLRENVKELYKLPVDTSAAALQAAAA